MNTSKSLDFDDLLHDLVLVGLPADHAMIGYEIIKPDGKTEDRQKQFDEAKAAIVEAVEGIYGDSDGLREFASTGSNQVADLGETSDGYHTFNELYEFRLLYNAALFNTWAEEGLYEVHKSWHHADAPQESIFGKGWFIVVAELPTGQISNHYPPEDWELFQVVAAPVAHEWDGHTTADVADRLRRFLERNDLVATDKEPK